MPLTLGRNSSRSALVRLFGCFLSRSVMVFIAQRVLWGNCTWSFCVKRNGETEKILLKGLRRQEQVNRVKHLVSCILLRGQNLSFIKPYLSCFAAFGVYSGSLSRAQPRRLPTEQRGSSARVAGAEGVTACRCRTVLRPGGFPHPHAPRREQAVNKA